MLSEIFGLLGILKKFGLYDFFGEVQMIVAIPCVLLVFFSFYILESFGLMRVARIRQVQSSWLAWIPFCRSYLLGKAGVNERFGLLLLFCDIVTFTEIVFSPFVFMLFIILKCVGLHMLYRNVRDKALLMNILCLGTCGLLVPVFLFVIGREMSWQHDAAEIDLTICAADDLSTDFSPTVALDMLTSDQRALNNNLRERGLTQSDDILEEIKAGATLHSVPTFQALDKVVQEQASVYEAGITPLDEIEETDIVAITQTFLSQDTLRDNQESNQTNTLTPLAEIAEADVVQLGKMYTSLNERDQFDKSGQQGGQHHSVNASVFITSDELALPPCPTVATSEVLMADTLFPVAEASYESVQAAPSVHYVTGLGTLDRLPSSYTSEVLAEFSEFKKFKEFKEFEEFKKFKKMKQQNNR